MKQAVLIISGLLLVGNMILMAQDKKEKAPALVSIDLLAGKQLYNLKTCGDCHNEGAEKYTELPAKVNADSLEAHVTALELPLVLRETKSARRRAKYQRDEVDMIAAYLNNKKSVEAAPENFVTAGFLMMQNNCQNCHIINGKGNETAPSLHGVANRHDRKWIIDHFKDPTAFVKDSQMPKFDKLSEAELGAMTDYLLKLQ